MFEVGAHNSFLENIYILGIQMLPSRNSECFVFFILYSLMFFIFIIFILLKKKQILWVNTRDRTKSHLRHK